MKKLVLLAITLMLAVTPSLALGQHWALGTSLGFMTVKTDLMYGTDLSVGIINNNASTTTPYYYLAKLDYNLPKLGQAQPNVALAYVDSASIAGCAVIDLTAGVSAMIAPNMSVGVDYILYSSAAGVNTFIPSVAVNATLYLM